MRLKADEGFNALNKTWVRLAMNESRGFGGACYGDSGGPNFVVLGGQRLLASTTITGDVPCYATNVTYRTDTPTRSGLPRGLRRPPVGAFPRLCRSGWRC